MATTHREAGPKGPALTGTDGEALLQAMRNLLPLLGEVGRQQAINTATKIKRKMDSAG